MMLPSEYYYSSMSRWRVAIHFGVSWFPLPLSFDRNMARTTENWCLSCISAARKRSCHQVQTEESAGDQNPVGSLEEGTKTRENSKWHPVPLCSWNIFAPQAPSAASCRMIWATKVSGEGMSAGIACKQSQLYLGDTTQSKGSSTQNKVLRNLNYVFKTKMRYWF